MVLAVPAIFCARRSAIGKDLICNPKRRALSKLVRKMTGIAVIGIHGGSAGNGGSAEIGESAGNGENAVSGESAARHGGKGVKNAKIIEVVKAVGETVPGPAQTRIRQVAEPPEAAIIALAPLPATVYARRMARARLQLLPGQRLRPRHRLGRIRHHLPLLPRLRRRRLLSIRATPARLTAGLRVLAAQMAIVN